MLKTIEKKTKTSFGKFQFNETAKVSQAIIPSGRVRYLSEITSMIREYDQLVKEQAAIASKLYQLHGALATLKEKSPTELLVVIEGEIKFYTDQLTPVSRKLIQNWPEKIKAYQQDYYEYNVRDKKIRQEMFTTSLSGTRIPKVVLPKYKDWGDIL